jgi:hypothetical protein
MDFLEDLFEFGDRKRKKQGGFFGQDDHHDHHEDDDHDDHHQNQPASSYLPNVPATALPLSGVPCPRCSSQTLAGAKFCHQCGNSLQVNPNCQSCGTKLPAGCVFCPQCGYKREP